MIPFSSGTQFADWQERNCMRCAKWSETTPPETGVLPCEIDQALLEGYWGVGKISDEMAKRMGYPGPNAEGLFPYTWDCGELEEKTDEHTPDEEAPAEDGETDG